MIVFKCSKVKSTSLLLHTCQLFYLAIFTALYTIHSQSKMAFIFPPFMYFSTYFFQFLWDIFPYVQEKVASQIKSLLVRIKLELFSPQSLQVTKGLQ